MDIHSLMYGIDGATLYRMFVFLLASIFILYCFFTIRKIIVKIVKDLFKLPGQISRLIAGEIKKRKETVAQKHRCEIGQHVFVSDHSQLKYEQQGSCHALVAQRCRYCNFLSWENTIKSIIHKWDGMICVRCGETREFTECAVCHGNGEVRNDVDCSSCSNRVDYGCSLYPDQCEVSPCCECHDEYNGKSGNYSKH